MECMYPDIRRMHTRWSCHRRLGSLMQCASSMCDVNCSSAITSHCLLEDVTLVEYVPCIGSSHARWSCRRRLGPLLVCACSMCDVNCSSAAITSHCLLNGLYIIKNMFQNTSRHFCSGYFCPNTTRTLIHILPILRFTTKFLQQK